MVHAMAELTATALITALPCVVVCVTDKTTEQSYWTLRGD